MSEKDRRRFAAIEAVKLGHGGISYIGRVLNCDYCTIKTAIASVHHQPSHAVSTKPSSTEPVKDASTKVTRASDFSTGLSNYSPATTLPQASSTGVTA